MKAIYQRTPHCQSCLDFFGEVNTLDCKQCMEFNRSEVEVLALGVGMFGNKAIIQMPDRSLEIVPISSITLKGESQ